MTGEAAIARLRAAILALGYAVSGIFILYFTLAGRRPWTGIAVFFILTWVFQLHVSRRPWRELGFSLSRNGLMEWGCGAVVGGALFGLAALIMAATGALSLGRSGASGPRGEIAVVLAVAALIEEMLFRGYPLQTLARGWGEGPALIASSALFMAAHLLNPGAGPLPAAGIFLAGWALGAAYLRWRSLWAVWGAHFAWNAVQGLLLGFPVSGLPAGALGGAALLAAGVRGPAWWTGGVFGPEGGLPALMILGAAAWRLSEPLLRKDLRKEGSAVSPRTGT